MTPTAAIFKKEFHQHGAFAVAMVCMCLFVQIGYVEWMKFTKVSIDGQWFFGIALFVTALYAGCAAALAYSTEHADNTFIFLRKLPVSWQAIACGKAAWVLCGTVFVLLCNLLLYAGCIGTGYVTEIVADPSRTCAVLSVAMLEAFVWGFVWSTRCRSQVHALLAAGISAVVTLYLITYFFATQDYIAIRMYYEVIPHRLVALIPVALVAVWGMRKWFSFEAKRPLVARLYPEKMTLAYPQRVQHPFVALVHHHIRHASILYLLGIFSMVVFSAGCLWIVFGFVFDIDSSEIINERNFSQDAIWWFGVLLVLGTTSSVVGMLLYWATIFGHDQKQKSYQFLSRIGVHEGKVWWSRMLPAMVCYVFVIVCFAGSGTYCEFWSHKSRTLVIDWKEFWQLYAPMTCIVWLAPMAMGAFLSISFRSQMVAIALTAGGLCLPIVWAMFTMEILGCSAWWTTVPICVALLVASRIRAAYWLRENFSWRSRLIPLAPVFGVILAVVMAIPCVRVFSVPYVSWKQIDAYFDQAEFPNMHRNPEKRKALLQHIAKHSTVPPEYEKRSAMLYDYATLWELNAFSDCTFEEFLLLNCQTYRSWDDLFTRKFWREQQKEFDFYPYLRWLPYMPWEKLRAERIWRLNLVRGLVDAGWLQDAKATAIIKKHRNLKDRSVLSKWYAHFSVPGSWEEQIVCSQQLRIVFRAIDKWYADHENTLPESLDELVEGGYLSAFPEHPFTGELMQYFYHAMPPSDIIVTRYANYGMVGLGDRSTLSQEQKDCHNKRYKEVSEAFPETGGTYLRLGKWVYLIVEPDQTEDNNDIPQEFNLKQ